MKTNPLRQASLPPRPSRRSELQTTRQTQANRGLDYARRVVNDPQALAAYGEILSRTRVRRMGLQRFLVRDFLVRPRVALQTGAYRRQAGDAIAIYASDDGVVPAVEVTPRDEQGGVLEAGRAVFENGSCWRYTASRTLPADVGVVIQVVARDLPGNVGRARAFVAGNSCR